MSRYQILYIILTSVLLLSGTELEAQTIVHGRVLGLKDSSPVVGVNVMIKNQNNRIITFSQSNDEGKFSMNIGKDQDSLSIHANMIGYRPYSKPLTLNEGPIEIYLEEGSLKLGEVMVKAARIKEHGDTITYNVAGFAQQQDHSIGDVLKRMPGIDVDKSGKIQYQGSDINKFYIEGSDLLGGKYGVATNGISHEDVGAVEILENHQPMQVLRGISFSEKAAINLRLKEKSKARYLIHGSIGGGYSENPKGGVWTGDLFAMMISGKYQTITTVKSNNTGEKLSDQLDDFTTPVNDENDLEGYISLPVPSAPNLEERHTYFNRSWILASNHLLKLKSGKEVKVHLDYSNDRLNNQADVRTTYLLPSGDKTIIEDQHWISHTKALSGDFTYEANEKNFYLKNRLFTDLSWNDQSIVTYGSIPNTQRLNSPKYSVTNCLTLLKKIKNNRLVTLESYNGWKSLPEKLMVDRNSLLYGQSIAQHSFYTDQRASLGFLIKEMTLSLEGGISGYFRSLDTDLRGITTYGGLTDEHLTTNYLNIHLIPKLEWEYKRLGLRLSMPVNSFTYFFSEGIANLTKVFCSPSLTVRLKLTPGLSLSLRGSLRSNPSSLHRLYSGYILTDYRSFSGGVKEYLPSSGQSVTLNTMYRNIRKGLFLSLMANHSHTRSKSGVRQEVTDDYVIYSYSPKPTDSNHSMLTGSINKTLDFIRGGIGLKGSYIRSGSTVISQSLSTKRHTTALTLSPSIHGNLFYLLNWNLKFTWDYGRLNLSAIPTKKTNNFIYAGGITFTPHPLIIWSILGEYYRNQYEEAKYKDLVMLDSKLTLNISKKVELSLSVTNLLNHTAYSYTTFGTLSECEHSNLLRGRQFLLSIYLKK